MDLSIVIVSWNTRELLRDCLASIPESGTGMQAEIIVIDNNSADGSQDMVECDFPAVRLVRNPDNRGFAAACNQGMEIALGRHLLLLNSDTVVHGDVLERSVQLMDARPDVGMMGCRVLNEDGTVQMTCSQFPGFTNLLLQTLGLDRLQSPRGLQRYRMLDWQRDDEREVEVISGCYLLARRETYADIGPMDEAFFLYGEETDWCRRCADAGWKLLFSPVGCITHLGSASSRRLNHRRDLLLSLGTVRLHRKHGSTTAALAVWLLLLAFNASRFAYWTLRSLPTRRSEDRDRALHFRRVTQQFAEAWPAAGEHAA